MRKHKHRQSQSAPRTHAGSMVESLESRQLLSAAFIEAGGRLVVRGTDGNDKITVTRNADKLHIALNSQGFDFSAAAVTQVKVEAGKGNDWVEADTKNGAISAGMFFVGDAGNDTLISNTGDDALIGGGDADVLIGKVGNNYVNGGAGNDKIFGGAGNDTLIAEGGTDYLADAGGKNTITADAKTDTVKTNVALPATVPSATGPNPVQAPAGEIVVVPTPTPAPIPTPTPTAGSPFVIGVWQQPYWSFDKWQGRGINTVVGYESMSGTVSVEKFSDEAVKRGLFMIRHANSDPTKDKNQKNLLAWMTDDEPDWHNTDPAVVQAKYNALKKADPNRPVMVNFSGASALWGYGGQGQADYQAYMKGADWVSNDLYPVTAHNRASALDAPGLAAERLSQWSGGKRQMVVIEASDQQLPGRQYDYPGVNANQFRAEVFNSVISGATGIIYFPQRIGDGFNYDAMKPEVEAEMKSVNARVSRIGAALMSQKDPSGVSVSEPGTIRATWRKYNGKTYLVVLNNSNATVTSTMATKGVSGTANVDGEGRSVAIKNNTITDTFKPYEAHVYVVG